ncbi:MAG: NAD(P)-dependent oxidoreductase [Actinomycetia bacterium]|nr:NAD(P)-dependent oxidoreductase [Actinomycetes bacterium]MCP4958976.1 NAD(P)-dependent oxidoreductase [Actinomycetes bacterium]
MTTVGFIGLEAVGEPMSAMDRGGVVIVMSTVSPTHCKDLAAEASESGITVLDGPVSAMVQGVVDGTLTLMIGGGTEDIERCREVFEPMGHRHPQRAGRDRPGHEGRRQRHGGRGLRAHHGSPRQVGCKRGRRLS